MMEIIIILLLLILNGIFAMYELALVSASRPRLEALSQNGNVQAAKILKLLLEPEKILSAIQIGITLISIIAGAYGGIALVHDIAPYFDKIAFLKGYAHGVAVVTTIGIITYFSLIIGELLPKSIALHNPEKIVIFLTPFILFISKLSYPFVWLLSISTKSINKLLGLNISVNHILTQEELKFILKQSSEHGVIDKEETQMIKDVIRFSDKRAGEIMTHRNDIISIQTGSTKAELIKIVNEEHFSKYLLCEDSIEKIIGVVSVKDMLSLFENEDDFDLTSIATTPLYIPENLLAIKVLENFKKNKTNFGVVISEYGAVEGIITLHDLTEAILGDIPEENEVVEDELIARHDGTFIVDGSMDLDDFMDKMGVVSYEDVEDEGYTTIAGMAMHFLNKVPDEGDVFVYKNLKFEIIDMDSNRVDKIIVSRIPME